ncbi:hypothetical protein FB451DRAFT_1193602 [Mycena latifolia]|nr:hypothetical protein FB451DRAFT_1193602 [Mycena latifolia]
MPARTQAVSAYTDKCGGEAAQEITRLRRRVHELIARGGVCAQANHAPHLCTPAAQKGRGWIQTKRFAARLTWMSTRRARTTAAAVTSMAPPRPGMARTLELKAKSARTRKKRGGEARQRRAETKRLRRRINWQIARRIAAHWLLACARRARGQAVAAAHTRANSALSGHTSRSKAVSTCVHARRRWGVQGGSEQSTITMHTIHSHLHTRINEYQSQGRRASEDALIWT